MRFPFGLCDCESVKCLKNGVPWLLLGILPLAGQELSVSSASGRPGETVQVEILLKAPRTQPPWTLKWDTVFPAQLVDPAGAPVPSDAVKGAGRTLTCTQRQSYSYVCILTGGNKALASGPVAVFRFKIRPDAHAGTFAIRPDHIDAVDQDLKKVKIAASEGFLHIHQ